MKTDLLHSAKRKQREAKLNSIKLQNIWKISKYSTKHDEVKINDMELNELTESTILPLTQNIVINRDCRFELLWNVKLHFTLN